MLLQHRSFLHLWRREIYIEQLNEIVTKIDDFVWGPVMLILLVGTGNSLYPLQPG